MKYPGQESITLEFKESIPKKNQIVNTVLGFCNRFGGRLIIGVNDSGDIIGVPEEGIDAQIEALHESIFKSCTPSILPTVYSQRFDDKIVLIVEVSTGMNKPYFLTREGMMNGTYIRLGSLTVKAPPEIVEELKWQARGVSVDEIPVYNATLADIDEQTFFNFLSTRQREYQVSDQTSLLKHYKIIIDEHGRFYPTIAGTLLFGREPQRYFPEAFIICTHFKGRSGRDVLATQDCTGTLFQQVDACINFILSRLHRTFIIKAAKREEAYEIPPVAIREMVINAIVHRNYGLHGAVKIAIYDDRIEIFSPGNFPGPLHSDQLEMGITYIRNSVICKIFRESGYIEKLGSGFLTLFTSYREYHLPEPIVIENTGFVKCILPRAPAEPQPVLLGDRENQVTRLLYLSPQLTAQDIVKHLGVSRQTAVRILNGLVKEGVLTRQGKGPGTIYIRK